MPYPVAAARGKISGRAGVTYLLRDDFLADIAAGSLNGTPATPGPGNRDVVDTGSFMSISGHVLSVLDSYDEARDPILSYVIGLARQFGRLMIAKVRVSDPTAVGVAFGMGSAVHDPDDPHFTVNGVGAAVSVVNGCGAVGPLIASWSDVVYSLCIIQKAVTGAYMLMKGDVAHPLWTLVWWFDASALPAATPLLIISSPDGAYTALTIREPDALFLIAPLAYDTFDRANGSLIGTETVGPDGQTLSSLPWVEKIGTWGIATNVAKCSVLSGSKGVATVVTPSANVLVRVDFTRAAGIGGLLLRYIDASNYLKVVHTGTFFRLIQRLAAVESNLITASSSHIAGKPILVELDGLSARIYYNNVFIGAATGTIDPSFTGATHGLYTDNVGNSFNNFIVFPRGNGGEYSPIDAYLGS